MSAENECGRARWRLAKACAVVLAIVCVVPGVDVVLRHADSIVLPDKAEGLVAQSILSGASPEQVVQNIEDAASGSSEEVPQAFRDEIGFLPGARDVRADSAGDVVGYIVEGDEEEVHEQLTSHMRENGWTAVPLAGVSGSTFVKEAGSCTWALSTCTQVGTAVSVVTRCVVV